MKQSMKAKLNNVKGNNVNTQHRQKVLPKGEVHSTTVGNGRFKMRKLGNK